MIENPQISELLHQASAKVNGHAAPKPDPIEAYNFRGWGIDRFKGEPPPLRYLIRGVISLPSAGVIYSGGGLGKTTLLLYFAILQAIRHAFPTSWLGFELDAPGKVVFFCAEDPDDEQWRRIKGLCAGIAEDLGVSPEKVFEAARDNLLIAGQWGQAKPLFSVARESITPTGEAEKIRKTLVEISATGPIAAIIFDTRSRYSGVEGSGNANVSAEVSWFESLAQQFGAAVLIVHHTRKGAGSPEDAARGESAFLWGLRFGIFLRNLTEEEMESQGIPEAERGRYLVCWPSKSNYFEKTMPFVIERDGFRFIRRDDLSVGRGIAKREARTAADTETILGILRASPGLTQRGLIANAGAATPTLSKARTLAALAALETAHRVEAREGSRGAKLYHPVEVANG